MFKAIDVSHWQSLDIIGKMQDKLNIEGVMIRAGHGLKVDEKMDAFVKEAETRSLHYGFYWYYEGKSANVWEKQTDLFLKTVEKYNPDLPLAIDYEEEICQSVNQCCLKAGNTIEENGYFCMVYSNRNFMNRQWNQEIKDNFAIWLASWINESQEPEDMWRYSAAWKCNVVMLQYTDTAFGLSIDCNEIIENLPSLCQKVRNTYYLSEEEALSTLKSVMKNLKAGAKIEICIKRNGERYLLS